MSSEITLKIVILGSSEVGKSCLITQFCDQCFNKELITTIGIDFKIKYYKFNRTKVKVIFLDTAGQEKFRSLSVNYIKGAQGVILVFDISSRSSFELIETWVNELNLNERRDLGMILIGNKEDLEENRMVKYTEGKSMAEKLNCKYFETSAKTGFNVNEAFDEISKAAYTLNRDNINLISRDSIVLHRESNVKNVKGNKKACCAGKNKNKDRISGISDLNEIN